MGARAAEAQSLVLLSRRGRHFEQLLSGAAEVFYIAADLCDDRLGGLLKDCPAIGPGAESLDFAANLSESFQLQSLSHLDAFKAVDGCKRKLLAAENFLKVLEELEKVKKNKQNGPKALPVLFTSTAVRGAARLATYTAGARAVEALCARGSRRLDLRCVALSAWKGIGICEASKRRLLNYFKRLLLT